MIIAEKDHDPNQDHTNEMIKRPGCKHTKLGWIPEDWEFTELADFAERSKSKYNPKKEDDSYKCIELEHLEQGTGRLLGFTDSLTQKSIKNKFEQGEILFGKLRPYLQKFWLAENEGVCSSEIWVLRAKQNSTNSFLFYLIQQHRFNQIANRTSGTKMPRADWGLVSEFPFPLPPLPEQQKIAQILSTWDKAIIKTEELIKQKQKRKQGLMQQLLTGKKQFKEFRGEKPKNLEIGDIIKP